MKTQIVFLILLVGTFSALAQVTKPAAFAYKTNLELTVGFEHIAMKSKIPVEEVLTLQYEKKLGRLGLAPFFAIGFFDGWESQNYWGMPYYQAKEGSIEILGIRANLYFLQKDKVDIYGGILAEYMTADKLYVTDQKVSKDDPIVSLNEGQMRLASKYSGLKLGFQFGSHIWIRRHFGVMGEISYGTALINLGIAYRR